MLSIPPGGVADPRSSPVQYLKNTGLLVGPGVRLDFLDFLD